MSDKHWEILKQIADCLKRMDNRQLEKFAAYADGMAAMLTLQHGK